MNGSKTCSLLLAMPFIDSDYQALGCMLLTWYSVSLYINEWQSASTLWPNTCILFWGIMNIYLPFCFIHLAVFTMLIQHFCRLPGDTSSQGIGSHGINLVVLAFLSQHKFNGYICIWINIYPMCLYVLMHKHAYVHTYVHTNTKIESQWQSERGKHRIKERHVQLFPIFIINEVILKTFQYRMISIQNGQLDLMIFHSTSKVKVTKRRKISLH